MLVDVIIPVYKPTEKLNQVLQALTKQTYAVNGIIIVHTEDGEDLLWVNSLCEKIPVTEIKVKKFDHGASRNLGIQASNAEVAVFLNQDAVPKDEQWLECLVNALQQDSSIAVAYARQSAEEAQDEIEKYTRTFNYPEHSLVKSKEDKARLGIKTYFCSNVCAAYKKEIYQELGGFEKKIIFNEDMVYAAGAIERGYRIAYAADAIVLHAHDQSALQLFKRNFDLGVSQACYPEVFETVKSENEGIRLVKETAKHFIKSGKPFKIVELVWKSGWKYLGYRMGKHYEHLPMSLVKQFTMNPTYWEGGNV